jgi:hypothetical protein
MIIAFVRVGTFDHFIDHRSSECRLPATSAAGDDDVQALIDRFAQNSRMGLLEIPSRM